MPRSRGGAAPRRPTAAPAPAARPAAAPANTRQSSTAAAAAAPRQAPAQQQPQPGMQQQQAQAPGSQGPGLFGQMASTAAGVAVGSSIGHAVGGWFSGGSSSADSSSPQGTDFAAQHQDNNSASAQAANGGACAVDVNNFRTCMDQNQGSLTICGWYLDQLKACQAAAGQY